MSEGASEAVRAGLLALAAGHDLSRAQTEAIFEDIVAGRVDPAQIGALLFGLATKGETPDEIAGAAAAMRRVLVPVPTRHAEVLDTCGTGGSGVPRRNVSTAVAIAVAACGVPVAKHGNRAATSRSGSADVLEAAGVDITAPPERVAACLDTLGVGFLFAPALHPAMRHAAGPRRALPMRTIFNLLGPMTNPAGATRQLLGVFDPARLAHVANALGRLGSRRVLAVHGFFAGIPAGPDAQPGIDDVSPEGETLVVQWHHGAISTHVIVPEDAGLARVPIAALAGGDPADNAAALWRVLDGEKGPYRTAVQLSGAVALVAAHEATLADLPAYADAIAAVLDDGRARRVLEELGRQSHHRPT